MTDAPINERVEEILASPIYGGGKDFLDTLVNWCIHHHTSVLEIATACGLAMTKLVHCCVKPIRKLQMIRDRPFVICNLELIIV